MYQVNLRSNLEWTFVFSTCQLEQNVNITLLTENCIISVKLLNISEFLWKNCHILLFVPIVMLYGNLPGALLGVVGGSGVLKGSKG